MGLGTAEMGRIVPLIGAALFTFLLCFVSAGPWLIGRAGSTGLALKSLRVFLIFCGLVSSGYFEVVRFLETEEKTRLAVDWWDCTAVCGLLAGSFGCIFLKLTSSSLSYCSLMTLWTRFVNSFSLDLRPSIRWISGSMKIVLNIFMFRSSLLTPAYLVSGRFSILGNVGTL